MEEYEDVIISITDGLPVKSDDIQQATKENIQIDLIIQLKIQGLLQLSVDLQFVLNSLALVQHIELVQMAASPEPLNQQAQQQAQQQPQLTVQQQQVQHQLMLQQHQWQQQLQQNQQNSAQNRTSHGPVTIAQQPLQNLLQHQIQNPLLQSMVDPQTGMPIPQIPTLQQQQQHQQALQQQQLQQQQITQEQQQQQPQQPQPQQGQQSQASATGTTPLVALPTVYAN